MPLRALQSRLQTHTKALPLNEELKTSDSVYPREGNSVSELPNVKRETERRERIKCSSDTNDSVCIYYRQTETFMALNLPRQCPIILISKIRCRQCWKVKKLQLGEVDYLGIQQTEEVERLLKHNICISQ